MNQKKTYGLPDLIVLPLKAAPVPTILCMLEQLISTLLPSAEIVVTALFVDTALAIFKGRDGNIIKPLFLLMGIVACRLLLPGLANFATTRRNMGLTKTFRLTVAEKRAKLEYRHIENSDTWDLIQRVGTDPAEKIAKGFDDSLVIVRVLGQLVSVLVLLAFQVWWAALIVAIIAVPLLYLAFRVGGANYQADREAAQFERRAAYLYGVLTGRDNVEERALFGYSPALNAVWHEKYEAGRKIRAMFLGKLMASLKGSSLIIVFATALIIAVLLAPLRSGVISIGMFMGFVTAIFNLTTMVGNDLIWMTGQIGKSREYLKDLSAFFALSEQEGSLAFPGTPDTGSPVTGPPFTALPLIEPRSIEFINVSFRYPGTDRDILKNLSLKFEAGRHYALVGVNGAGKTTITKLLTGLYTNYEGEILIDESPQCLQELRPQELRPQELRSFPAGRIKSLFSVVYQDFAKYQLPLQESVGLGAVTAASVSGAGINAVSRALEKIGLEDLVEELPRGLDTPLGKIREGGVDISGGQWQRVAIARSLANPAPVRILDEPTAALDPAAESAVYELYGEISRGKTTIFITHRLGAARLADEILVIDGGRLAERGSHEELVARGGLYAAMYESQRGWYA
ncbi:MAG: ABC transporter ATP-binding protein/permease [Treponema sp.]|jgi:ATP-binding cassette subfamily B protein|nr:ABC transporter ATP-binding protein/permease [Treponema sp.]